MAAGPSAGPVCTFKPGVALFRARSCSSDCSLATIRGTLRYSTGGKCYRAAFAPRRVFPSSARNQLRSAASILAAKLYSSQSELVLLYMN